jgi:hypothetical protein
MISGILDGWECRRIIRTPNDPRNQIGIENVPQNLLEIWQIEDNARFRRVQDIAVEALPILDHWKTNALNYGELQLSLRRDLKNGWYNIKISLETILTWCWGVQACISFMSYGFVTDNPIISQLSYAVMKEFPEFILTIYTKMNQVEKMVTLLTQN